MKTSGFALKRFSPIGDKMRILNSFLVFEELLYKMCNLTCEALTSVV